MKANVEVKFPCGYEYKMNVSAGMMDFIVGKGDTELPDKCPLHGKNCPPKK